MLSQVMGFEIMEWLNPMNENLIQTGDEGSYIDISCATLEFVLKLGSSFISILFYYGQI